MSAVITVIAGIVALVAGASLARPAGRFLKRFGLWAQIAAGVLIAAVAVAIAAYGLLPGNDVWWGVGLGLGFGGLAGLRYGRGTLLDLLGGRKASDAGEREP